MNNSQLLNRRLLFLAGFLGVVLLLFLIVMYQTQIVQGSEYRARSMASNADEEVVEASRGTITDRNGKVLVSNRLTYTLRFSGIKERYPTFKDYILESYNKYPFVKLDIIDNTKVYNYFFTRREREKIKNVKKQIKKSKSNVLNYLCYELNIKEINDEEINKKYQEMYNFFNLIHNKK